VFLACIILLEQVGLDSRQVLMSFATLLLPADATGAIRGRAVLSLEQGLTILLMRWLGDVGAT